MKRLIAMFLYEGKPYRIHPRNYHLSGPHRADFHCFGVLLNWRALWVGWHYSPAHKRLCINLLPGVTLWWSKPGGQLP